jgi:hypothetical protein
MYIGQKKHPFCKGITAVDGIGAEINVFLGCEIKEHDAIKTEVGKNEHTGFITQSQKIGEWPGKPFDE